VSPWNTRDQNVTKQSVKGISVRRPYLLLTLVLLLIPFYPKAADFRKVSFRTDTVGTVLFDHDIHLQKLRNNCTECHNKIFNVKRKGTPVTMAEMEKGVSCGACHNGKRAFGLKECLRCHTVKDVPIRIPDLGSLPFPHEPHIAAGYGCSDCHPSRFRAGGPNEHVTMAEMEMGKSCGACHDDKTAFTVAQNCTKCHVVKDIVFAEDVLFSHTFHLSKNYRCQDCHSRLFIAGPNSIRYTMQEMERGRSCGGCHEGRTAFSVRGDCDRCHKAPKLVRFEAGNARFPHDFHLGIYRCADCHSGIFRGGKGSRRYTMKEMEGDRSCGACHDGKIAFSVTGSCDRCHPETKEISIAVKHLNPVPFSHEIHRKLFACSDCHYALIPLEKNRRPVTMKEMEGGKSCGGCHDDKTAFSVTGSCGRCHPVRTIPYPADAQFSHDRHLQTQVCYDCHARLFKAGPGNPRVTMKEMEQDRSCGACHDGAIAFSVKGDCNRCHKSAGTITFAVPTTGPLIFSHEVHVASFACTDCHYGIFTTGADARRYTMRDMEEGKSCGACHNGQTAFSVKDACDRCHPVREITFPRSGAIFSHKVHIGLFGCTECHTGTYQPGPGNRRYSMKEMEGGGSCGKCHDGKTAFSVAGSCQKCHPASKAIRYDFPGKSTGSVLFSHKVHLARGFTCNDCHYTLYPSETVRKPVTMKEMWEGKSCGKCHGNMMAFSVRDGRSCNRCHKSEEPDI